MKLKVAIIGCGSIAEFRHAPEYHANPSVEIAAFCDPMPGRAQRLADRFGGVAFTNHEDALAMADVGAVSVCTANSTHAAVVIKALRAGKHVLCEKPIATSLSDARQMIREAERHGRNLMIGHNQRMTPAHIQAKALLDSGALGPVITFRTTFGHGGPETWSADKGAGTWFFKKSAASLGALGDLGVHKADLLRWLIADEIDEVVAAAGALNKTYENGEPIDVEDNAVCLLQSRRGILGTLTASWTHYGEEDNSTVLYCEKGILSIFASAEHPLTVTWRDGSRQHYDVGAIQTNESQTSSGVIDAFVSSVLSGAKPPVTGEDGFEALSIALACSHSAKTGLRVPVSHCRDGFRPAGMKRWMSATIAVQSLKMETNLTPDLNAGRAAVRFCDETYPGFPVRRRGKEADSRWRRRVSMEMGRQIN